MLVASEAGELVAEYRWVRGQAADSHFVTADSTGKDVTIPASAPAAPATTISGIRCSSRGWHTRAAGAASHAASFFSRSPTSPVSASVNHPLNACEGSRSAGPNLRMLWNESPL